MNGTNGAPGPPGPVGLRYVSASFNAPTAQVTHVFVLCAATEAVTGGGVFVNSGNDTNLGVNSSYPTDSTGDADTIPDDGWVADVNNTSGITKSLIVYAICTTPNSIAAPLSAPQPQPNDLTKQ
jgi:hypothetical protein